jgi:hypothetical protein
MQYPEGQTVSLPTDLKEFCLLLQRKETAELEKISVSDSESASSEDEENIPGWANPAFVHHAMMQQNHSQVCFFSFEQS